MYTIGLSPVSISGTAGVAVVTATMPGKPALEDPKFSTSVFTYYFIKGLEGAADSDKNGLVTLDEAFNYARNDTAAHYSQRPLMENRVQGEFPLSIIKSGSVEGAK